MKKKSPKKTLTYDEMDKLMAAALQDEGYKKELTELVFYELQNIIQSADARLDRDLTPLDMWCIGDILADEIFTRVLRGDFQDVEDKKKELM
jgi:hypothetical protein